MIPPEVLRVVQWIDLEKFDIAAPPTTSLVTLTLQHINPLLERAPEETAQLFDAKQLALPVAKNGAIPPG